MGPTKSIRKSLLALLSGALVLAGGAEAGQRVASETLGYSVEVPTGWKHKLDADERTLLMGAPGGFRVRIDVRERADELSVTDLKQSYKRDGKALLARYGKVKVLERPTRTGWLGKEKSYGYTFVYRDLDAALMQVETHLATGSSLDEATHLEVKVRAYGDRRLFPRYAEEVEQVLASFVFPSPEVPVEPEAGPAEPTPSVLALVDLPPEPVPSIPTDSSPSRERARPSPSAGSGATVRGHDADARAYDRGSLSGGVGFMREARRSENPEHNRIFLAAFGIKDKGKRSEEEKRRAAAYLGFNLKK